MTVAVYINPSPQSCSLVRRLHQWAARNNKAGLNEGVHSASWSEAYKYLLIFREEMINFMIDYTPERFAITLEDMNDWVEMKPKQLRVLVERLEAREVPNPQEVAV